MKAITLYLPQYHSVKENNEWWGDGYTDWKAMEKARPLYDGHKQPKMPMNHNMYDLEKKKTMQWQSELMKKYGIYGMAIYHYWFKDGRQILERPVENLLKWTDVDMPFCLYWANESWVRSWSAIGDSNVWAANFEQNIAHDENDNGVLLEQDYGNELDWEKHYDYFEQFFNDDRYIKINGKPVIMIYKPNKIACIKDMVKLWRECAEKSGWDGIYLIGAYCNDECREIFDMQLLQEPGTTIDRSFPEMYTDKNRMEVAKYLPYDLVWKHLLEYKAENGKTFFGGFSNYDDTPRRKNAGIVIYNGTAEKFKVYLTELYAKNAAAGNEYVFINAWNEWGEGMYLEPDEEEKFGYLEAISYAEAHYKQEMYKYANSKNEQNEILILEKQNERLKAERKTLNKWLMLKQKNIEIDKYLSGKGYRNIAIYGYGILGKLLFSELQKSAVNILCVIDMNADGLNLDIPVKRPFDELDNYDLIIVSNIHIYQDIANELSKGYKGKIISLEQIIDEASI